MTKDEIKTILDEKGIEYNDEMLKDELTALLPVDDETTPPESEETGLVAKKAFYFKGTHFKIGDDVSKLDKKDIEFLSSKGKL